MQPETTYLRYIDDAGTVHVVQNLDQVPAALRSRVERFTLGDTRPDVADRAGDVLDRVVAVQRQLPAGSVWIAGVTLLVAALVLWKVVKKMVWIAGLLALAAAALLGSGYLGSIRAQVGLAKDGAAATPEDLMRDARQAADKLRDRERVIREEIERLQRDGR